MLWAQVRERLTVRSPFFPLPRFAPAVVVSISA